MTIAVLLLLIGLVSIDTYAMSSKDAELKTKADYWLSKSWNLAEGGLTADADYYFCDKAEEYIRQIEWPELRADLMTIAHATRVELDKVNDADQTAPAYFTYFGNCRVTAYCSCSKCCGKWAGGPTASGSMPAEGITVANGSLPFGTKVKIDGHVYTVQDRGVGGDQFDIYMDSHNACLIFGMQHLDVYVEEGA